MEIAVFSIAGIGMTTLLGYAARKFSDAPTGSEKTGLWSASDFSTFGVGGRRASPLLRVLAYVALPLAMVISTCHLLYGHDQPGDGFTAGVITSIGIGFWYVVFGFDDTRRHLGWLRPSRFILWQIIAIAAVIMGTFFSVVGVVGYKQAAVDSHKQYT